MTSLTAAIVSVGDTLISKLAGGLADLIVKFTFADAAAHTCAALLETHGTEIALQYQEKAGGNVNIEDGPATTPARANGDLALRRGI